MSGLRQLDPKLAGLYELGLMLADEIERPGHEHVVAFIGRELSRGVIRHFQDEIDESAQDAGCSPDGETNRSRIAAALKLPEDDVRVAQWSSMPQKFAGWEKYRAGTPLPYDVREGFDRFSQMLYGLVAPYYATETELRALLAVELPASEHVRQLRNLQLRSGQRTFFFERLKDARWIALLSREGFFANPPGIRKPRGASWRPRRWPEGSYLVRVASEAPTEVERVLVDLPDTNDNPVVWSYVAKAASELPVESAVCVVPKIKQALKSVLPWVQLAESVTVFIERLAASGRPEVFELAEYLLYVAGPLRAEKADSAVWHRTSWVVPRLGGGDWHDIVHRLIAALEGVDPESTLCLLLRKVDRVQKLVDDLTAGTDQFIPARVATSLAASFDPGDDDRANADVVTKLGRGTISVARRLAASGSQEAATVFALVKNGEGHFSEDLRRRVLRTAGHFLPHQLDQFLLSEESRDPGWPATEVAALLRSQFRNASAPARRAYAAAVEVGPDRDGLRDRMGVGSPGTVELRVQRWQRRILTFFHDDIPDELRDLASRLGLEGVTPSRREQQMAERGMFLDDGEEDVWLGPVPSLAGWSAEEVVALLREDGAVDHIPLRDYGKAHPAEGVNVLAKCAADDIPVARVDGVLAGAADAVESGADLDWALILKSIKLILRQIAGRAPSPVHPTKWRGVWDYSARLIRQGCARDAIPAEYAHDVWDALGEAATLLTTRPDPTQTERTHLDQVLLAALNDGAGTVPSGVVAAGLWQYRFCLENHETASEEERAVARAVVQRRVVPILDRLLDADELTRPVSSAVLGQQLPWLLLLAPRWVDRNIERLFGGGLEDPITRPAWTAYIGGRAVYRDAFDLLRAWYASAANDAAKWKSALEGRAQRPTEVSEWFARHLLAAFLHGWIRLGDDDELLETAYANLAPSDWRPSYHSICRDLQGGDGTESPAAIIIERLGRLWRWRVKELQQGGTEAAQREEGKILGYFLRTPQIPAETLLQLGPDTARLADGLIELNWGLMLELAQSHAEGTFEIVEPVLVGNLRNEADGYVPVEQAKLFLGLVLQAAERDVQDRVRALINLLGERGYRDFKDLLARSFDDTPAAGGDSDAGRAIG